MSKSKTNRECKKHHYIDINKLYDFSEPVTLENIADEFRDIYKITNIGDIDFEFHCICEQLADDYANKRANYKAYIEKGMNARILTELRNSAILPVEDSLTYFYGAHSTLTTQTEIIQCRNSFISSIIDVYKGEEWQYYMLLRRLWGRRGSNIIIDFEPCFEDGEDRMQHWKAYYRMKFLEQHFSKEALEDAYLDDRLCP